MNNSDIDQLTGLPKRLAFEQHLRKIADAKETGHALCQIDIDSFMVVNDVYGHASGDALLVAITALIQQQIAPHDMLARTGNDEYGLILKNCNLGQALTVVNTIREEIKKLRTSDAYSVTVSIGLTMLNDLNNFTEVNLKNVDVACRAAKQSGDKVQLYQGDDHFTRSYHHDTQWVDKIKSALEDDRFQLFAQKIEPLTASDVTNKPVVFELLLRMVDVNENLIYPGAFLPIAAKHNLASRIDLMVLKKVIQFLNDNTEFADNCSMIMVNLSGQSLSDEKILDYLSTHLIKTKFSPKALCFEITETEAIPNVSSAINFINLMRGQFGCRFAIDDFGSGFCSFRYLKELPVDIIKLDGDFVKEVHHEPFSQIVVQTVCDIAKLTHKKIIAEWIETKEVLNKIQSMGVDYGQGYYLAHPTLLSDYSKKF